jgi:hypothetical protein
VDALIHRGNIEVGQGIAFSASTVENVLPPTNWSRSWPTLRFTSSVGQTMSGSKIGSSNESRRSRMLSFFLAIANGRP